MYQIDFEQERNFSYKNLSKEQITSHIVYFISRLWQIHPFGEGNTRTTAVFTIKYLRYLGFDADNEIFAKNAWYFRNALVRANYKNVQKNILETPEFLEVFFRNILMGEKNELKNRYCHIEYRNYIKNQQNAKNSLHTDLHTDLPANLRTVLEIIKDNPSVTIIEIAKTLNKNKDTIRVYIKKLKEEYKVLQRVGADKNGYWKII